MQVCLFITESCAALIEIVYAVPWESVPSATLSGSLKSLGELGWHWRCMWNHYKLISIRHDAEIQIRIPGMPDNEGHLLS